MEENPADCPCRAAIKDRIHYGLETEIGHPKSNPAFADMVQEDMVITCRRCGQRWKGEYIVGGGIYGDTLWRRE